MTLALPASTGSAASACPCPACARITGIAPTGSLSVQLHLAHRPAGKAEQLRRELALARKRPIACEAVSASTFSRASRDSEKPCAPPSSLAAARPVARCRRHVAPFHHQLGAAPPAVDRRLWANSAGRRRSCRSAPPPGPAWRLCAFGQRRSRPASACLDLVGVGAFAGGRKPVDQVSLGTSTVALADSDTTFCGAGVNGGLGPSVASTASTAPANGSGGGHGASWKGYPIEQRWARSGLSQDL